MKVAVAFLLVALSCCFTPSPAIFQQKPKMEEHVAYFYTYRIQCAMTNYQKAQKCTGADKSFRYKCSLHELISCVKEYSTEMGCGIGETMKKMGLPLALCKELLAFMESGKSVHSLSDKKCEHFLGGIIGGMDKFLKSCLGPHLGALKGCLTGALQIAGNVLGAAGNLVGSAVNKALDIVGNPLSIATGLLGGKGGNKAGGKIGIPFFG